VRVCASPLYAIVHCPGASMDLVFSRTPTYFLLRILFIIYISVRKRARMDQQLIAIIVLFGFRLVLLAIPVFDNFWLWTMRRFLEWRNSGNAATAANYVPERQVIDLHELQSLTGTRFRLPGNICSSCCYIINC